MGTHAECNGSGFWCAPCLQNVCMMAELGEEDHSFRQYFYSASTLRLFVALCQREDVKNIALLSTPSIFYALNEQMRIKTWLLEFDRRWADGNSQFVFYDFNEPVSSLPAHLKCACD